MGAMAKRSRVLPIHSRETEMTDIKETVQSLKDKVNEINTLMRQLGEEGVEVRITYIEPNKSKEIAQGINLWRIEQHINLL